MDRTYPERITESRRKPLIHSLADALDTVVESEEAIDIKRHQKH